jgi:hypothetical protein
MNHHLKHFSANLIALATLLSMVPIQGAWAQIAPDLGTASNFAVLGGAGVTCTNSTITGDAGSLLTVTPTATCTITGAIHAGDAVAIVANSDFLVAYAALANNNLCPSADATHNLTGNLGGMSLSPGLYCISGTGLLTSTLTLNGPSNGIWIFKADTDLTPIAGSVVMAGGGQACNVYWETGTAVSLDATQFLGNILAGSAVTFTGVGSTLFGRALAKTAVTMTGTRVFDCGAPPVPPACTPKKHDGHDMDQGKCDDGHDGDNDHGKCNDGDDDHKGQSKCKEGDDDDKGHGSDSRSPFEKKDKHDDKKSKK